MLSPQYLVSTIDALEDAAIALGRAQAEGTHGRKERERVFAAERLFWERTGPLLDARNRELRRNRRRALRLVAALIGL